MALFSQTLGRKRRKPVTDSWRDSILLPIRAVAPPSVSSTAHVQLWANTAGKLVVTGPIAAPSVGSGEWLDLDVLSAPPAGQLGRLYFDDGSNTLSGEPGLRMDISGSGGWRDVLTGPTKLLATARIEDSSGNSFTMSGSNSVRYRVNNESVTVMCDIRWNDKGSAVAGDNVRLYVLPYPPGGISEYAIGVVFSGGGAVTYPAGTSTVYARRVSGPSTYLSLRADGSGTSTAVTVANLNASGNIQLTFTYPIG